MLENFGKAISVDFAFSKDRQRKLEKSKETYTFISMTVTLMKLLVKELFVFWS